MDIGEIYKITCPAGKIYVGQCVKYLSNGKQYGTLGRWNSHLSDSRRSNGGNCRLLNIAIREMGELSFKVETIMTTHVSLLDLYEEATICLLDTTNTAVGYNIRFGGKHTRLSDQTRMIMSNNRKAKPCFSQAHTQTTKDKISKTLIDKTIRLSHDGVILPKYVKYIHWDDRQGYAIVSHPKCKKKYFVSTKSSVSVDEQFKRCIDYLTTISAGSSPN
jgi:hypothetical protein